MGERMIQGKPGSDEQIEAWATEAEAGYDVEVLRKRGRGRPGRGAEPTQLIGTRWTASELAALDAAAARDGVTRSDVIRRGALSAAQG